MWCPERFSGARRAAIALFALSAFLAPFAAARAQEEREPSALGRELLDRFEIRTEDDALLLEPKAESSAVRSIEIEDDDVLVNGKRFDEAELAAFLGREGELLRELVELPPAERLEALGFPEIRRRGRRGGEVDISVPVGVPGPRIHIRPSGDERVSIGRSIKLEKGETASNVVCIGCSVEIEGHDSGDAVAIGGSVRVSGTVEGNAVSVGSSVLVADGAVIEGDAVSVGGAVSTAGSGEVQGETVGVGLGGDWFDGGGTLPWQMFSDAGKLASAVIKTGLLALLAVLVLLLARPAVDIAAARASAEPWKAAFAGLLAQLLVGPLFILVIVVLCVSIIGIPLLLLLPFAILGLLIGWFVGFVAVARALGGWVERRFGWHVPSAAIAVIVGVVLIQATALVGRLLALPAGFIGAIGIAILALGFFLKYVAWTIGLGAMTLIALGGDWRRPSTLFRAPTPPPPPPAPTVDEETAAGQPAARSLEALPAERDDPRES